MHKILGICAFFEVPHGILCIFGSSLWDFVPFWKFLMGFCAFLEDPASENAQNPMIDFK
jgi:hypothetical protein